MEKENIKVYNLTVVELESRELTAGEAEIALNDVFVNSIANITENVMKSISIRIEDEAIKQLRDMLNNLGN